MPTEVYRVTQVYPTNTRNPLVTRYQVCLESVEGSVPHTIADTVNELRASLCQRAKETDRPVRIGWRDTRWGHEIITAEFADEQEPEGDEWSGGFAENH